MPIQCGRQAGDYRWNKAAMCGHKGGKCLNCNTRVTPLNVESFHFDHVEELNCGSGSLSRWGNNIKYWAPFTEEWFQWAKTVNLMCELCHRKRHNGNDQISIDWEAQHRMDEHMRDCPSSVE